MEKMLLLATALQESGSGQATPPAGQPGPAPMGCQGMGGMLIPIVLMFVIIYFLMIRPQQKQQKKHKQMIEGLKKGDKIITNAGIFGAIVNITEAVATIEIAKNTHIRILRTQIAGLQPETLGAESAPVVPENGK